MSSVWIYFVSIPGCDMSGIRVIAPPAAKIETSRIGRWSLFWMSPCSFFLFFFFHLTDPCRFFRMSVSNILLIATELQLSAINKFNAFGITELQAPLELQNPGVVWTRFRLDMVRLSIIWFFNMFDLYIWPTFMVLCQVLA